MSVQAPHHNHHIVCLHTCCIEVSKYSCLYDHISAAWCCVMLNIECTMNYWDRE